MAKEIVEILVSALILKQKSIGSVNTPERYVQELS